MSPIRISSAATGTLCGLTGILAGIFLILRGNEPTNILKISTIGPEYLMWEDSTYVAWTLVPNFLISGIITLIVSTALVFVSIFYINKRYGSIVFLALSVLQLLTGGGFVIDLAVITFLLSLGINSKLKGWRKIFLNKWGKLLASLWLPGLVLYSALSVVMLSITILGVNRPDLMKLMIFLAGFMFLPVLLMIFGSLAYEIRKSSEKSKNI
jgi:hypothetical protein